MYGKSCANIKVKPRSILRLRAEFLHRLYFIYGRKFYAHIQPKVNMRQWKSRLQNSQFFFLKISKEIGKAWRKSLTRAKLASLTRPQRVPQSRSLFSASFQTFCLTVRAYQNTQKYGLFCSLVEIHLQPLILKRSRKLTK